MNCCALGGVLVLAALTPLVGANASTAAYAAESDTDLYLITLTGPGTAGNDANQGSAESRTNMIADQDATLGLLGADDPTYRWTTALNGFAVELTPDQAASARTLPTVDLVEPDTVRPVAGTAAAPRTGPSTGPITGPAAAPVTGAAGGRDTNGRGTVIGIVDTGISPAAPALVATPSLGAVPARFAGTCDAASRWSAGYCNGKIASATWFVKGFGADRLRAEADLSPLDDSGHGTQVASIAAGNAKVTALSAGRRLGNFSGTAPDARLAIYKACWSAPDPTDDGCSTADVVSAIDRAVHDRVDVLNVSVDSPPSVGPDTVDLALLGAVERDIFVATAAGNDARTTGYLQPWVTTVGASTSNTHAGALELSSGDSIKGALAARRLPSRAPVVLAGDVPAPGRSRAEARLCTPGALDASRVTDKIVLCERGEIARVDKSSAVRLADGVAMVLVNAPDEALSADFHAVPTLNVDSGEGARLRRAAKAPGRLRGRLVHVDEATRAAEVLSSSNHGSAGSGTVKPDLIAPGFGLLAATAPGSGEGRWQLLSGTSGATARVSGMAARIRAAHPDWSAARTRSALMTSARQATGSPGALRQGAGVLRGDSTLRPGLVFDLGRSAFRRARQAGRDVSELNLPAAERRVPASGTVVVRRVTNVGTRSMYYSSSTTGFRANSVKVVPAAIKIAPGETSSFRVRIRRLPGQRPDADQDSGSVTWRGADGTRVAIPVVLTR